MNRIVFFLVMGIILCGFQSFCTSGVLDELDGGQDGIAGQLTNDLEVPSVHAERSTEPITLGCRSCDKCEEKGSCGNPDCGKIGGGAGCGIWCFDIDIDEDDDIGNGPMYGGSGGPDEGIKIKRMNGK